MHRLTARLLLVLLLVSVFAPVALAASTPPQTACCLRNCCRGKAVCRHTSADPSFDIPSRCDQDCSRSVIVSIWAELSLPVSVGATCPLSLLSSASRLLAPSKERDASHSGRGPPQTSIA